MNRSRALPWLLLPALLVSLYPAFGADSPPGDVERLVAAMLGETPLIDDAAWLTDQVGGRPTGSAANLEAVEWALERFRQAGVAVRKEAFTLPARWAERSASAVVSGPVTFYPRVVAMPFSVGTGAEGLKAPLVDGGLGEAADFQRLGETARGAWVLIETPELQDIPGLFTEYTHAAQLEPRAFAAGAVGVVYQGSRSRNVLHRKNAALGPENRHPLLAMERDAAARALRLLREGRSLTLTAHLDVETGGPYESYNVVGEIRGSERPEEVVLIGAHLDSWGLGTGALDNAANCGLVIDLARQIHRLGLEPRRTIRFVLWNGEEQGMYGSWGYTKTHADSLDDHVLAQSYDLGTGRITGFFTNGRGELTSAVDKVLAPVRGLGPFQQLNVPIVGTDNFDFMMQGVPNLVANQESANYGPNYHADTDTFDKIDAGQLRINAAIAAAVTWGFAQLEERWPRQGRTEVQRLVDETDLGEQLLMFNLGKSWESGERGRRD